MGAFATGQVVILPFPFSDLTRNKYRPVLLLANVGRGDWIVCQITSNAYADPHAVQIQNSDFISGGLQRVSYARPGKLFTAHETLFSGISGEVLEEKLDAVRKVLIRLLKNGNE
jgi:mRNA interferase MazF